MRSGSRSAAFDTSGIIALLLDEPAAERIDRRLAEGGAFFVGAPTLLELRIVLSGRLGRDSTADLAIARERIGFSVVAFTELHSQIAFEAWMRYGKGRHPAGLNMGDCLSYAAAKVAGAELIYVGDDFAQTDLA